MAEYVVSDMAAESSTASGQRAPLLRARHLRKQYVQGRWFSRSKLRVASLDDVSLAVHSRSTVALVGESGSGKSTLARCLARLLEPDSGEIWFEDKNLLTLSSADLFAARRQIQLVFQSSAAAMNPRFSAAEIVGEPLLIQERAGKRERRKQALAMMEQVGIPSKWAERSVLEFSGGERKRLTIARALVLPAQSLQFQEQRLELAAQRI